MAGAKHHDYHLVNPSVWPMIASIAALVMFFGGVMWMHADYFGGAGKWVFGLGVAGVILTFFQWWADVIREAHAGDHTPVVQLHLRYGMILFIASEVMFFVGWFWAWFDFSLFPVPVEIVDGAVNSLFGQDGAAAITMWPPKGIHVIDAFSLPLLNTMILLCLEIGRASCRERVGQYV